MKLYTLLAFCLITLNVRAQQCLEQLMDINSGPSPSFPIHFYTFGNKVFFGADNGSGNHSLWLTDGTPGGTVQLSSTCHHPKDFTKMNGLLYFSAIDGSSSSTAPKLWVTNGTAAGTHTISNTEVYGSLFALNNILLFSGAQPGGYIHFWKSDGTNNSIVKMIDPTSTQMHIDQWAMLNNKAYFVVSEVILPGSNISNTLWETDGTEAGTKLLKNLSANYSGIVKMGARLYFGADDGVHGFELWATDGTTAGTEIVKDIEFGNMYPERLTVVGEKLFFTGRSEGNGSANLFERQLFVSNGTAAGTILLTSTPFITHGNDKRALPSLNGKVYFTKDLELWESDGTIAGTRSTGASGISPWGITVMNNQLYYLARNSMLADSAYMYQFDPLSRSTQIINNAVTFINYSWLHNYITYPAVVNNTIVFSASSATSTDNYEPWYLTVCPPLNVAEVSNKDNAPYIYPNPGQNYFSIKGKGYITVQLFNLTGQMLLQTSETQHISISHLPSGTYMVRMLQDGVTHNERLIKE